MAVGEVLKKRPFKVALKVIISLPPCSLRDDRHIEMAYSKAFKTDLGPTCCACCSCCCNCCGGRGIADLGCMQTDCTASCLQDVPIVVPLVFHSSPTSVCHSSRSKNRIGRHGTTCCSTQKAISSRLKHSLCETF